MAVDPAPLAASQRIAYKQPTEGSPVRVLLVSDDDDVAALLASALADEGHAISRARTLQGAVEATDTHDVVLVASTSW